MILDKIVAHKKKALAKLKESVPLSSLEKLAQTVERPRGFRQALACFPEVALIAEVKKASPSAGVIRNEFDPVEIGKIYEDCGASAISVLTDNHFFQGSLSSMQEVRQAVRIPVLRKDFIIDPFQIYEARASGADAVLLIVAILSDRELVAFLALCRELGLETLVEVHTEEDLNKAIEARADVIGINNRNLKTFEVDIETTLDLITELPKGITWVSESGITNRHDITRLGEAGVDAVLVGTTLMKAADIGAKVRELLQAEG